MEISKKDWKKYIQSLAKINEVAANEMLFWIKMHPNATRNTFIEIANAIAVKYGEASGALACQMYDEIAKVQKVKVQPAEIAPTTTIPESAKMVNALYNQKLKIAPGVGRQVKQVAADTMLKNAKRDRAEFAWITSGDGCMFCRMISSFGWQHASKKVMNDDHAKHIHNNCKCEFVIRFDGKMKVEGYDPDSIKKEFDNAEGNTLKEKVNYLRRKKYARENNNLKLFNIIYDFYNKDKSLDTIIENSKYEVGKLSRIISRYSDMKGKVFISGHDIRRIINKHGKEFSYEEFKLISKVISNPDYIADNRKKHKNSLLLYSEIHGRKKSIMECAILKKDNENYIIHFHKIRKSKIKKLEKHGEILYKHK